MDLEGKLGREVGGIATGDYSRKGADGGVEGMDAGENFLVKWPVIACRVSRRFQFFPSAMIVIFFYYYRVYYVYMFVSAYVWMVSHPL